MVATYATLGQWIAQTIDAARLLSRAAVFSGVSASCLAELAGQAVTRYLEAGDHLFREGELGTTMYVLGEGQIRLYVTGRRRRGVDAGRAVAHLLVRGAVGVRRRLALGVSRGARAVDGGRRGRPRRAAGLPGGPRTRRAAAAQPGRAGPPGHRPALDAGVPRPGRAGGGLARWPRRNGTATAGPTCPANRSGTRAGGGDRRVGGRGAADPAQLRGRRPHLQRRRRLPHPRPRGAWLPAPAAAGSPTFRRRRPRWRAG